MDPSQITIWTIAASLKEAFVAKAVIAAVLSTLALGLGMNETMVIIMFGLMLIDLITGIAVAIKVRKERITSKGLWVTSRKITLFSVMMATTALLSMFNPLFKILHIFCINYVAASEALSNLENLSDLGLKEAKAVVDKLKGLLKTNKLR